MRFLISFLLYMMSAFAFAQPAANTHLDKVAKKSWYQACYKVPADSAFAWLSTGINFTWLNQQTAFKVQRDTALSDYSTWPSGHYIWVKSSLETLDAFWEQVCKLSTTIYSDGQQTKMVIYHHSGAVVTNATVFVDGKKATYLPEAKVYTFSTKKWKQDEAYNIKICTPGDTLICTTEKEIKNTQHTYNKNNTWKTFPVIKQSMAVGKFVKRIFNGTQKNSKNMRKLAKQRQTGFVLFSKPIYKPGDTVKLKAWIINYKEQPVSEKQQLWISYYARGSYKSFELAKLDAVSAGSFVYSFALPDSFPNDTRYNLDFRGPEKGNHLAAVFKMEEYKLPDISAFNFTTSQSSLLPKDTLSLSFDATGTNGLPLLDASVDLVIMAGNVNRFYPDSLFVKDTLYKKNYPLLTDGKMMVKLPATMFPAADMTLRLEATLKNSSNETTYKSSTVELLQHSEKINFTKQQNKLTIIYTEDDIPVAVKATVFTNSDILFIDTLLSLPATINIHPLADEISVQVYDKEGKKRMYESYNMNEQASRPSLQADARGDSIGFVCQNPGGLMVNYVLFKGNKIIWQQQDGNPSYRWHAKSETRQLYHLQIHYFLNGEAKTDQIPLGVNFKNIDVQMEHQPVVQPGAKDTLRVTLTDYKHRPVAFANLTATGQNTQLKSYFNFPVLPYKITLKDKYKQPPVVSFSMDEPDLKSQDDAAKFPAIAKTLGLDSMAFYGWLFSTAPFILEKSQIHSLYPEVHVNAVSKGRPQEIFITYINKKITGCYWQNTGQPYSTIVYPGYVQVGIRTAKSFIEIDSIYMQPYYKHDIIVNLDSVINCKNVRVKAMPDSLITTEKLQLEKRFIKLEPNAVHNNIWLWQQSTSAHVQNASQPIIAGPFENSDSIRVYKENNYDFKFPFEPGYTYRITKNLVRLEKENLFRGYTPLRSGYSSLHVGDTIPQIELPPPPKISPAPPHHLSRLRYQNITYSTKKGNGTLKLHTVSDSNFSYIIILPTDTASKLSINYGTTTVLHDLRPGSYDLIYITRFYHISRRERVFVRPGGLSCFRISPKDYAASSAVTDSLLAAQNVIPAKVLANKTASIPEITPLAPVTVNPGESGISGVVSDNTGKSPIPGVSLLIKGTTKGTTTDIKGHFQFAKMAAGKYIIVCSAVGYLQKEVEIYVSDRTQGLADISMEISEQMLNEVVVVGYGNVSRKTVTGSMAMLKNMEISQTLQGRMPGVHVGSNQEIRIRGFSSNNTDNKPLIVIDGVLMDEMPDNIDTSILKIEVLKNAMAVSLYGARAANGVIIISTGRNNGPAIRTKFKDDAYWVPNTITDNAGKAAIPIDYPENITNWQNVVYAAATKGRYGSAVSVTKAFKAVQGLLSVPPFLITGDSVKLVGKAMNFSANPQRLQTRFTLRAQSLEATADLASGSSSAFLMDIVAPEKPDTLKPSFIVKDAKQNADGEERSIPVFDKGTLETRGRFFVLDGDTTIRFKPAFDSLPIRWYAENKLINVLEKELEQLKNYPQACMEQTANKLWGLVMMRKIKQAQGLPFVYEKLMAPLTERLVKNQLETGGWGWWPGSRYNLYITAKVLQALRQLEQTETIKQSIRNGFIYLQNQLAGNTITNKLEILTILSDGRHVYPYQFALDSLRFDSLSVHQQWQLVSIKQKSGLPYEKEITALIKKQRQSMTGGVYWGIENWQWYNNQNATTVLAFHVLKNDVTHGYLLPRLKQYFLEQRRDGYYRNTVEQAEISALLLSSALQKTKDTTATTLIINGKKISDFPVAGRLDFSKEMTITKTGNGWVFLGMDQQKQNTAPQRVDSLFDVQTVFALKNGDILKNTHTSISVATGVSMQVKIVVKRDAQFVQLEFPIPAGMVYANKPQWNYTEHREYLKSKVVIFKELMPGGEYEFTIPLETRFSGSFTLNPAKAELMYFPVLFGREEMKKVTIQ